MPVSLKLLYFFSTLDEIHKMVLLFIKNQKKAKPMTSVSLHTEAGVIGLLDLHKNSRPAWAAY